MMKDEDFFDLDPADVTIVEDEEAQVAVPTETGKSCVKGAPASAQRAAIVAQLNQRFAVLCNGEIIQTYTDAKTGLPAYQVLGIQAFRNLAANYPALDEKNSAAKVWLTSPHRRQYQGIEFSPAGTTPGYYNTWAGLAVTPSEAGSCDLYLAHVRDNVCQGSAECYEYLLNWMAMLVQHPAVLPEVAVVLQGQRGTGKDTFVKPLMTIFGQHAVELVQVDHLLGKFNANLAGKVLVFANESVWAGNRAAEGALKALITQGTQQIEPKGREAYTVTNYTHLVMATNNEWAVPAAMEERRFFVLEVGNAHRQDHAYFGAIMEELDNGGTAKLLHTLLHRDLTGVNIRTFPKTMGLAKQKLHTEPILGFIHERLAEGFWVWTEGGAYCQEVPCGMLLAAYRDWLRCAHPNLVCRSQDEFLGTLQRALGGGAYVKKARPYDKDGHKMGWHYIFPSWASCVDLLQQALGVSLSLDPPDAQKAARRAYGHHLA